MSTAAARPAEVRAATAVDLARQVVVAVSALVAMLGLLVGLGVFGGPETSEAAGGALASETTLIAPAGPAFSIWTPIYAGLLALGLWQLAPSRRADPRQRRAGWWIAVTMLANALWLIVVQQDWIWVSVAVMGVLLASLAVVAVQLRSEPPASRVELVLVDVTMGLYLGWVCVAAIANVAAALAATGTAAIGTSAVVATVVMLAGAVSIGWFVVGVGAGGWPFTLALAWGLAWIAVARTQEPAQSGVVAAAAAFAAAAVALAPLARRRFARRAS